MSSGKDFPDRIPATPSVDNLLDALKYDEFGVIYDCGSGRGYECGINGGVCQS